MIINFVLQEAELAMLERLPLLGALEAPTLTEQKSLERAARLQELLHFCVNEELRPSGWYMRKLRELCGTGA